MRWIVSMFALALAVSTSTALAQTQKPDVSAAPSAQNSGAGIAGQPGTKSGPAVRPTRGTIGSTAPSQHDPRIQQQDSSNIKGLPGKKSGQAAKQPSRQ